MIHRLRAFACRRRVARLVACAHGLRSSLRREWRWALRDIADIKAELRRWAQQPERRRREAAALRELERRLRSAG